MNNINIVQSAIADMKGGQARTICELCLITLCEPDLGDDLPLMRERLARLEQTVRELSSRPVTVVQQSAPQLKAPHSSEEMHADFPFGVDETAPQPIYGQPHSEPDVSDAPPFDIDREYDELEEEEDEYLPETAEEPDEADELYYLSQLPPIPELPPLPGDPVGGSDYGDPRAALMSFSTQVPERLQPETPPEEVPFDLDIPSFMREPEDDKPAPPVEIKRRIYVDEAAAPPEAKEAFGVPTPTAAVPATPKAAAPAPSVSDGEIWEKTKAALSGNMPFGLYLLLTDSTQVEGFMQLGELILSVKSSFAMNMLNRPDVIAKVASVASSFAGRSVTARMMEAGKAPAPAAAAPAAPKTDKLDELGRFEVVSFK